MNEKTTSPLLILSEEPVRNLPDGAALFSSIGVNFSSISETGCELIDNAVSNILRHSGHTDPAISNEISLTFADLGSRIGITIRDGGTGIENLHNTLTIAGKSAPDTTLNAHGFGLKHSIFSMVSGHDEGWWIETRTAENLCAGTYCRVEGPFGMGTGEGDPTMKILHICGTGAVGDHTGTVIHIPCSRSVFQTARPDKKYAATSFSVLVSYIIEHIRFTYAPLLTDEKISIRVITIDRSGQEKEEILTPLLPDWKDGTLQEFSNIPCDLGGGKLLADICFGLIEPSRSNHFYFTGTTHSSGVQVACNGRVITNKLYSAVYGKVVHNSQNHFIAQIDLHADHPTALPSTKNTKTAFNEGDPRYAKLLQLIATHVPAPDIDLEKPEDKLKAQLQTQEKKDPKTLRADREEMAFGTSGVKALIDLFVTKKDGSVAIYEAKAGQTKVRDVAQLLLYILGCIHDGKPADRAVLIAARHSKEVLALIPTLNELLAALGIDCKIEPDTWENRGISA